MEKTIWKQGITNKSMENDLLEVMKRMAVKKQNLLLNVVTFLGMAQDREEPAKHFVARLRGQATVCNFILPTGETNYMEHMIKHQLVRGISDPTILEQVLAAHATEDTELTLQKTINFIEAKESGKADASALNKHRINELNRISEYKSRKARDVVASRQQDDSSSDAKCMWSIISRRRPPSCAARVRSRTPRRSISWHSHGAEITEEAGRKHRGDSWDAGDGRSLMSGSAFSPSRPDGPSSP